MPRRSSSRDGESESPPPRRLRRAISYAEDEEDEEGDTAKAGSDSEAPLSLSRNGRGANRRGASPSKELDTEFKEESDHASEDSDRVLSRQRRKRHRSVVGAGEDLDFHAEHTESSDGSDFSDSDQYLAKLRDRQFIASDDELGHEGYGSKSRKTRRKLRKPTSSRHKRIRRASLDDHEYELAAEEANEDSIQQEIKDLQDSSAEESPVKHKLREREKIDYTIPSLLTNENEGDLYRNVGSQSSRPRKRNAGSKSDFRKLLFPTAGPFGGSDVISLLGQNIPPGGIPIPGLTGGPNLFMALGNDSDSSDDEPIQLTLPSFLAPAPAPAAAPTEGTVLNHTSIRGAQVGKKRNNLSDTDPLGVDMNIDFLNVGGLDNYIDQLKEMVALPLLYPELYQNFSITPPRGVLFHGPPGTGKTLMARALAASCSTPSRKITFFMRKGADCLSKWVGEAERQLRLLFEEAKNQQPSIIFFDEIDGLAPVRSSKQEQIHASIVSTLLALMDGMDNRGQVIVIGATNRPDSVDPALRRPGRFDREFYFPLPNIEARKQIISIHTKKWTPAPSPVFIDKIAHLTKGYGGADLRALCTEAALNSIQRKYPQIYKSNDKLQVVPRKVKVVAKDFMRAIDKIVPSSARSTSSGSAPLPERIQPLLEKLLDNVAAKLNELLPGSIEGLGKKMTNLDEALYLDPTVNEEDGGFAKHEFLKTLESSRVFKPHLLVCGSRGSGQQYLGAAILNILEGFQVQNLDLATIFGDVTRTPELCIVQTFIEARRHQPSIIYIPNIETWFDVMTHSAKATLAGLLRNLRSNEKVLLLGIAECPFNELEAELKSILGFLSTKNILELRNPDSEARLRFMAHIKQALCMKPYEYLNDLHNRPKRRIKALPKAPLTKSTDPAASKQKQKQQEYEDTKLKNVLKLKLAGIMDLFKNRYKRFKKPVVDDALLSHLYDPAILEDPTIMYEVLYEKSEDATHPNMIKELATGRYFYNMDLDTIEERIWNGYYSEGKQFMKDIRMIVKDSITTGDRERILKANEMLTNAQFGIDDFNHGEFAKACKALRERELLKQEKLLSDYQILKDQFESKQAETLQNLTKDNNVSEEPETTSQKLETGAEEGSGASDALTQAGTAETSVGDTNLSASSRQKNGVLSIRDVIDMNNDDQMHIDGENKTSPEIAGHNATVGEAEGGIAKNPPPAFESECSKVQDGDLHDDAVDQTSQVRINGQVQEDIDADTESEAEPGFEIESGRELVLPKNYDVVLETEMVNQTENFNLEKLEYLAALFMEVIWEDRGLWDKTETVKKLQDRLLSVKNEA